jgi:hypothetical protein
MAKSIISDNRKKRVGRPAVGAILIGVRVPPAGVAEIDAWIKKHAPAMSRPEAIRRLVDIALTRSEKQPARYPEKVAAKARELASKAIDDLIDPSAPAGEKAIRKRRLLKGPSVFRDVRVDRER